MKRKAAQDKADEWETLSKERAKARQAHRVMADIDKAAHKSELPDSTTGSFLEGWLQRRKGEIASASLVNCSPALALPPSARMRQRKTPR